MLVVKTPLRISLFGGGTDFPSYFNKNGGAVLTMAINKYIFVVIRPRMDERIRTSSTSLQLCDNRSEIEHELIREAMYLTGLEGGVEIVTIGDVPAGTGLGSSSTVTVGLLKAMYAYLGADVSTSDLAKKACEVEIDKLNKPIGLQDQYIAAYGGLKFIVFEKNFISAKDLFIEKDVREYLDDRLMLFYTGVSRRSEDILTEQEGLASSNKDILDEMKKIAYRGAQEIRDGNPDAIGFLLDQSWNHKKKLSSGVSNEEVDHLYDCAKKAGATGGKLCGAGGGGFLLVYVPSEKKNAVRDALKLPELSFRFESRGSGVIFDGL